ncbi:hypothetical protein O255_02780, partial [Staphylococcus aureus M0050]
FIYEFVTKYLVQKHDGGIQYE